MNTKLFEQYNNLGIKIIPMNRGSKTPIGQKWYIYNKAKTLKMLKYYKGCNIGLLLGDIIDIESDTKEGDELVSRLSNGSDSTKYRSNRYHHRLYKNPYSWLKHATFPGIEFRAYGHCSVLPPSIHSSGVKYKWVNGTPTDIPQLPAGLKNLLLSKYHPNLQKATCSKCSSERVTTHEEIRDFIVDRASFLCDDCKLPKPEDFKIAAIRGNLLASPKRGELEFDNLITRLKPILCKFSNYKRKRVFVLPRTDQCFFIDFYFYHFNLAIMIDDGSPYCWQESVLNRHNIRTLRIHPSDINSSKTVLKLLTMMSESPTIAGNHITRKLNDRH